MIEERQHDWVKSSINDFIESVNQKSDIWFINCKINCSSIRSYSTDRTISLIVFLIEFARQQSHEQSTSIYLSICSTISSTIARVFYSLQLEKNSELYAFVSQINAFSSISFETIHRFVRQQLILFRICTSIFITIWNIWSKHTRLQAKSTRSFCSRSRMHVMNLYRKFSSKTIFIFFVKFLSTYKERLTNLQIDNWNWNRSKSSSSEVMIVVEFNDDDWCEVIAKCTHCSLKLLCNDCKESLKKHIQKSFHCSLALQLHEENIVAESKIEFFFASVSLVEFLNTYENKLASLQNWNESTTSVDNKTRKLVVVVDFQSYDNVTAKCIHCYLSIFQWDCKKSFKKHFQKSFDCSLVLHLETAKLETSEVMKKVVKQAELKILEVVKRVEFEILEIVKFISIVANLDYFDATFLCDIQKFNLFCEIASFLQQLRQRQHQYRESDLLILLSDCLRDSALIWYKEQSQSEIVKKSLSEWLEILIIAFFTKSFADFSSSKFEIFASNSSTLSIFSSQYHSCLNCFAFFSFLTRLLQHNQSICKKVVCKHCEKIFESNNKFHEHVRQHHTKSVKSEIIKVSKRNFNRERNRSNISISTNISTSTTPSISSKTTTKFSISRPVTLSEQTRNSSSSLVTSAAIASFTSSSISLETFTTMFRKSVTTQMRSRFSLFTSKRILKRVKTASTSCSLFISLATFSLLRKSFSKSYFTIHDFRRMFAEKSRSFDLRQHQNRFSFSHSFESRQSDRFSFFYQFRIIAYFLSAVNQKTSISQSLKSSNSKNFQQYTFAKSISFCCFASTLSEKTIISSYKKSDIFFIFLQSKFSFLQSRFSSRFSFAWSRFTFSFTFSSFFRFSFSDHVDCICFDHFNFRNDSSDYSWFSYRYSSNRRLLRKIWER